MLGLSLLLGIALSEELVRTPHGFRPAKCVIKHDENPILTEDDSGVHAYYPGSKTRKFFPKDPECERNAKLMNLQAWDVYASYSYPNGLSNFTSTYIVPNESPTCSRQLLYYFIGFQNNGGSGVTIVQPVVNYDCSGQYPQGWSMEAWNCCPAGQSHEGKNVKLSPGDSLSAYVLDNGGKCVIGMDYNGDSSVLSINDEGRNYNWACSTLEQYSTTTCNEYNSKPFQTNNMVITSKSGSKVTPQWRATNGDRQCSGGAKIIDAADISIYGTNAP